MVSHLTIEILKTSTGNSPTLSKENEDDTFYRNSILSQPKTV